MESQPKELRTWIDLNSFLMGTDDEFTLKRLLKAELAGKKRRQFALRIHSRLCQVRRTAEVSSIKAATPPQRAGRRARG